MRHDGFLVMALTAGAAVSQPAVISTPFAEFRVPRLFKRQYSRLSDAHGRWKLLVASYIVFAIGTFIR
jgi:hypothetical protein